MTLCKVMLVFEDKSLNREEEVTIKDSYNGRTVLDLIDKAVKKKFSEEKWISWNLIDIL